MKYIVIIEYSNESESVLDSIKNILDQMGDSLQLSEHSFVLNAHSNIDAISIREAIKSSAYEIDRIFISGMSLPAAWRSVMCENSDLKELLNE